LQRLLHHLLRLIWTALLLACTDGPTGAAGGAAEDCALAATNLLSLVLQRKSSDFAALLAAGSSSSGLAVEAARPGAAPPPPLPAAWATPSGFLAKCEEYLTGSLPERPGILFLLQVLAGHTAWVDGSKREGSWELKHCAGAAAAQAQQLLQTVRQHAGVQAAHQQGQQQDEQQPVAGAAAGEAAATAADGRAPGSSTRPAAAAAAAGEAESQSEQRNRKAKQKREQMLARMRAQQAKAAAALFEEEGGEEAEAAAGQAVQQAPAEAAAAMEVDAAEGQQAGAAAAQAAQQPAAEELQGPLPAHHPAAWEQTTAECALCHSGCETAPLGLVAQLQVTELPLLASVDPASPTTPEHPGLPAGAVGAPSEDEAVEAEAAGAAPPEVPPFPAPGTGPRLSVLDRHPSLHLLCCGHVLHAACLERYRCAGSLSMQLCIHISRFECAPFMLGRSCGLGPRPRSSSGCLVVQHCTRVAQHAICGPQDVPLMPQQQACVISYSRHTV